MKNTILAILQQRMDKCTKEQFWAVGIITALDGFVFSKTLHILNLLPSWLVVTVLLAFGLYSIFYVLHRHKSYYNYRDSFVSLIKDAQDVPEHMKLAKSPWGGSSLIGTGFYVVWLVSVTLAVTFHLNKF